MTEPVWVIVGRACRDCGGEIAVHILEHEPDDDERALVKEALGGMYCIETRVARVEPGEIGLLKEFGR